MTSLRNRPGGRTAARKSLGQHFLSDIRIAGRILAAAEAGPVDPYRTVAAALLGSLDRESDLDKDPEQVDEPMARAACLLANGSRDAALEAFSQVDSLSALAETAKRLAGLAEEDAALAELLDGV